MQKRRRLFIGLVLVCLLSFVAIYRVAFYVPSPGVNHDAIASMTQ